jgi:hypothetical protein
MTRFTTYPLRFLAFLLTLGSSLAISAQTAPTADDFSSTGRHRIAYHYGTLIAGKENGNRFVQLFRKHTIPVVSIDYSFYFNRHWSIGADAAVYLPDEYRIRPPKGYSMVEGEDGNRNITAGSFMINGTYTHTAGPVELTYTLGIGFSEFTAKQDYFYIMSNDADELYTMRLRGKSGFAFTVSPQVRVSRHLSNTLSIFLEGRYNILSGKSTMRLSYAENDVNRDSSPMLDKDLSVALPNSFNINFGFTLRFGKFK